MDFSGESLAPLNVNSLGLVSLNYLMDFTSSPVRVNAQSGDTHAPAGK